MPSSARSDNSEAEEHQSYTEPQIQSIQHDTGISHTSTSAPNVQYPAPLPFGAGNAMVLIQVPLGYYIYVNLGKRSTRVAASIRRQGQTAYPYPDPYYRSIFAPYETQPYPAQPVPYPAQPMVHLQLMGIQQAGVPLPSDAIEEPVFVNAKQYHGIMRRRQSRAKAESENKALKSRKPYLHESRHLHAIKRARGCGGRFLNAKKDEKKQKEVASNGNSQVNNINLNSDRNDRGSSESEC